MITTNTYIDSISLINYAVHDLHNKLGSLELLYGIKRYYNKSNTYQHQNIYIKSNKVLFTHTRGQTPQGVYFDLLEFQGLKKYQSNDEFKVTAIHNILSYLHLFATDSKWELRQLDIALDIPKSTNQVLVARKPVQAVKLNPQPLKSKDLFRVEALQQDKETGFDITKNKNHIGSLYNKALKEKLFNKVLTRFEVSIKPNQCKKLNDIDDVKSILEKYSVFVYDDVRACNMDKKLVNNKKAPKQGNLVNFDISCVKKHLMTLERFIDLDFN